MSVARILQQAKYVNWLIVGLGALAAVGAIAYVGWCVGQWLSGSGL